MVTQARQRIRDLQIQKAETPEGLQDIFKNSEELKEFVQQTLYDSPVLKTLELHCEANSLPLAETLSNVVGSLDKYEAENEDMRGWPDLPSYIEEQLDICVTGEQQRKRQEQLQKEGPDFLLNFKCSFCGAPYETMTIDSPTGEILCKCGKSFKLLCPGCKGKFAFDANKAVFYCKKCNLFFERPTLTYRDYTFLKEPPDFSARDSRKDTPRSS
jgi:hypothetical protein